MKYSVIMAVWLALVLPVGWNGVSDADAAGLKKFLGSASEGTGVFRGAGMPSQSSQPSSTERARPQSTSTISSPGATSRNEVTLTNTHDSLAMCGIPPGAYGPVAANATIKIHVESRPNGANLCCEDALTRTRYGCRTITQNGETWDF